MKGSTFKQRFFKPASNMHFYCMVWETYIQCNMRCDTSIDAPVPPPAQACPDGHHTNKVYPSVIARKAPRQRLASNPHGDLECRLNVLRADLFRLPTTNMAPPTNVLCGLHTHVSVYPPLHPSHRHHSR